MRMTNLARLRYDLAACAVAVGQPLTPWQADALALEQRTTVIVAPNRDKPIWIAEPALERAVCQALGVAARIFERVGFSGAVDIGTVISGIAGCRGITTMEAFGGTGGGYGAADYRRSERGQQWSSKQIWME
jgi:hypothetical protein